MGTLNHAIYIYVSLIIEIGYHYNNMNKTKKNVEKNIKNLS